MTTSAIQTLPGESSFGYDFNYAQWSANSTVSLHNVPWNSDYRDIVKFADQNALDNYLDNLSGPSVAISGLTYLKMNRPIRLDLPFNAVNKYNYLRAFNPAQPVPGGDSPRAFYYFITDVNYVGANCTEVMVQLDVWQSFGFGVSFGNCYIEQGHIGIANQNAMSDFGRDYLTVPEGLDVGGEYIIAEQWKRFIASARGSGQNGSGALYSIMITTIVSWDVSDFGTKENPNLITAKGSSMENLPNGAEIYVIQDLDSFRVVMDFFSDKPWITEGIVSIQAIPDISVYGLPTEKTLLIGGRAVMKAGVGTLHNHVELLAGHWRDGIVLGPNNRYAWLKKFLTYPYSVLELTSYQGAPIMIKPESWNDPNAAIVEVPHFAGSGSRIMFYPFRYNASSDTPNVIDHPEDGQDNYGIINDGGEFYDVATGIFNFPTFSIVNNQYINYMASNKNTIAYQHQSAEWSQQRALMSNDVAANQATSSMNTNAALTNNSVDAMRQSTILQNESGAARAIQGMTTGAVMTAGNMAMGGPVGSAVGASSAIVNSAVSQAIDMNQRNQQFGITAGASIRGTNLQNENAQFQRDTNKNLADAVAHGDYANQIAGINARVQDAKMIQPTTAGQIGGESFTLATYKWGYDLKLKMLQGGAMNIIGEYWLRYGYKINRFAHMPADLQVMTNFTYWKLKETYITSFSGPEKFKQAIRGIFEKGVTVWRDPANIGTLDIGTNYPVPGVTL
jgi:hypothetical protein